MTPSPIFLARRTTFPFSQVAPPPNPEGFTGWDVSLRPAFTPQRTIHVSNQTQLASAINNALPGDDIICDGNYTVNGQFEITKRLTNYARINLGTWLFRHNADYFCIWLNNCSHWMIYGGDISNTGNIGSGTSRTGVRAEKCDYIYFWDFYIHDCNGNALHIHESRSDGSTTHHLDFRGRTHNCSIDYLNLDPHAEPGTGMHSTYLGSSNGWVEDSTVILVITDQSSGAGIQHGPNTRNMYVEIDARRLTFPAESQVAGCAYSVWKGGTGPGPSYNCVVGYLYAEDCTGRAVECDGGIRDDATLRYTINYARALRTNTHLAPGDTLARTNPFCPTDGAVLYDDCLDIG